MRWDEIRQQIINPSHELTRQFNMKNMKEKTERMKRKLEGTRFIDSYDYVN